MARIDQVLRDLEGFISELARQPAGEDDAPFVPEVVFAREQLGALLLSGDEAQRYRRTIGDLARLLKERASQAGVSRLVETAILRGLDPSSQRPDVPSRKKVAEAVAELKKALTSDPRQYVTYFPIRGMTPPAVPWQVGDVIFLTGDAETLNGIVPTSAVPGAFRRTVLAQCLGPLRNQPMAAVRSAAIDQEAACSLAQRRLRFVLDCLGFYTDVLEHPAARCQLSDWPGQPLARSILTVDGDGQAHARHYNMRAEVLGPLKPFDCTRFHSEAARKLGVPALLDMIARADEGSLAGRIVFAIQWAGRAAAEPRIEEAFLLLAISLESCVLGRRESGELTLRLAQNVAHLLGRTLDERRTIAANVRRLYNTRSKIVHSGEYEVAPEDHQLLRAYVKGVFIRLLTDPRFRQMKSEKDLDTWFECAALGAPIPEPAG